MAKTFGALLSIDAKGSIGKSITYQKRPRGNAILKPPKTGQTKLKNPTASQQVIRGYVDEAVAAWQALTLAQRQLWNDYVT